MITYEEIIQRFAAQVNVNGHLIGAVAGSGMVGKYEAMGGADFILALSAGKYRLMGRSSSTSYFCFGNSNEIVMETGQRELLPLLPDYPVLFGLAASDPFINLYDYLKEIKRQGFAGIVNFPTLALIDGNFRQALEEDGNTYANEIEAIKLAHYLDLYTVAFVTDERQTRQMLTAGADVICVHLGFTKGGFLGAKKYLSIDAARKITGGIFNICESTRPQVLRMIYAGPANTPIDMQYMYQNTKCQGYIGGSTFDRIPIEQAILKTTQAFKSYSTIDDHAFLTRLINGDWNTGEYVDFTKKYINEHYMQPIHLRDLALVLHISPSYLSVRFKQETGCSFTDYLLRFRMNKAKILLESNHAPCKEIAEQIGYSDYSQFSKMFKKMYAISPQEIRSANLNTSKNI